MREAGYALAERHDFVERQEASLVFVPAAPRAPPALEERRDHDLR